jgi:hypothetical protein
MKIHDTSLYNEQHKGRRFRSIHIPDSIIELVNRCESMINVGWEVKHVAGRYQNEPYYFWVSDLALSRAYEQVQA